MNATIDAVLMWLLHGGLWWAALAAGLALWFRARPPQTSSVRHAALAAAIFAGTLAGALPRWGSGLVVAPQTTSRVDIAGYDWPLALRNSPDEHSQQVANGIPAETIDHIAAAPVASETPTTVEIASSQTPARPRDLAITVRLALGVFWLGGALVFGVRLARATSMAARWRRDAQPLPEGERATFDAVRRELAVQRRVDAGLHPELLTPLVLCGRPPLVLVPTNWADWDEASRLAAWRHELAHVRRYDDWWRALSEILRVIWWFHPGVRWMLTRREHEAELLSDEAAVAGGCPPQELARILIDACRRPQPTTWPAPAGAFLAPRTTKARIARLIDAASAEALCQPAPRALRFAAAGAMTLLALAGSMRWVAAANAAPSAAPLANAADPPKREAAPMDQKPDTVKVVGRLIDDATGKPVTHAQCEWGLANPEKRGEFFYGSRGEGARDGAIDMTFDLHYGRLIRFQILAAGYEKAEVVEEIPRPTPTALERTVRLKRGPITTGTLRDHAGKPVAGGKVFFLPAGRAWQSVRIVEGVPDSPSVAETRTGADGRFSFPTAAAGMLAASTDSVDLWAFPLPPLGASAELAMPAPATLVIDLAYWYLDAPADPPNTHPRDTADPNQCTIVVIRLGTRDPLVNSIEYLRSLNVFAMGPQAKVSKGVTVGTAVGGARAAAIPGEGRNRSVTATTRVALPPGRYELFRSRAGAGAYAPIDRTVVELAAGGETRLQWTRGEGAAVRGMVRMPANSAFVRAPGEAPRTLDWSVPMSAYVAIRSADGTVRDAARIGPDGSFFVATHLEPGAYKAVAMTPLPSSTRFDTGLVGPPPDLEGEQEFVVPAPPQNNAGAPPVKVEVTMKAKSGRIVPANAALKNGPLFSGTVELPTGLLFRRQANKVAVVGPNPRPLGFKGVSVDPDDGRVVEDLGWKHVLQVDVFVKANDGRTFSAFTKTKTDGTFALDKPLPVGGYQVDASATLEMDDNAKNMLGEPPPDLNAGTVLIRVGPGDQGPINATLKLHPAPFTRRLRNDDPTQRMPELRGALTNNGNPVPEAKIVLYGGIATRWKIADEMTDAAGKFRFENVISSVTGSGADAKYFVGVQVEHPRLVPADGKSWRDVAIPTKAGTVETLDLTLIDGGFVEGRLLGADGTPRKKAAVRMYVPAKPGIRRGASLFHAYATTDDRGEFRSPALFPGRYFVEENAGDYPLLGEVVVEAGKTTKMSDK